MASIPFHCSFLVAAAGLGCSGAAAQPVEAPPAPPAAATAPAPPIPTPTPAAALSPVQVQLPAPATAPAASPALVPAADRVTLADLRTPVVTISREEAEQLLTGAVFARIGERPVPLRWTNEPDGRLVANSFTRQGLPLTEFGIWRVNEEGQYCISMAWLSDPHEKWCRHLVRNQDGYYLAEGLALTDGVERCEVSASR